MTFSYINGIIYWSIDIIKNLIDEKVKKMKKAVLYIDDVIWTLRDLTRKCPESIFDIPFFAMLKKAHEDFGIKVQLNLFYRTDFYYGADEFTLSEVPDTYKEEFTKNSDWLKFAFHAKQEFPDYPYINISYDDMNRDFNAIKSEVVRFAGINSFSHGMLPHWASISEEGIRALCDNGIKIIEVSIGETEEFNGNPDSLPYGHAGRLLQNRKPETKVFMRDSKDTAIARSICSYNHISTKTASEIHKKFKLAIDEKYNLGMRKFGDVTLNLETLESIEASFKPFLDGEFVGICDHEQYFYPEYFAYQPDYAEKIFAMGKILKEAGFEFIFMEEMPH